MNGINDLFVSGALNQTFRPKRKKLNLFGKEIAVENWVKFVAQNACGDVFGFGIKPRYYEGFWYAARGESQTLYQSETTQLVENASTQLIKL